MSAPQGPDAHPAPATPITKARWLWASAAVLLLFVAGRCLVPMDETDLFYNLRLGEIILATRSVPRTNLLSYTNPPFPLGVVWANGNSCYFLAPAVLALYAAGAWADGRGGDARRAALVAACLVPLAFATPCRTGVIGYVANHFRMPSVRPLQEYRVAEWPLDGPFFFLLAGVAVTAAGKGRELRHLLPIAALALLGARRIRFV